MSLAKNSGCGSDLEGTGVVPGREGNAEIHEGLEIDGAMSTRQTVQRAPKLTLWERGKEKDDHTLCFKSFNTIS